MRISSIIVLAIVATANTVQAVGQETAANPKVVQPTGSGNAQFDLGQMSKTTSGFTSVIIVEQPLLPSPSVASPNSSDLCRHLTDQEKKGNPICTPMVPAKK